MNACITVGIKNIYRGDWKGLIPFSSNSALNQGVRRSTYVT